MKMMFLNIAHGMTGKIIEDFVGKEMDKIDMFCLEEADEEIRNKIRKMSNGKFTENHEDKNVELGKNRFYLTTLVRKKWKLMHSETIGKTDRDIGMGLICWINVNDELLRVVNVHGVPLPGDKLDNEARLKQSKKIIDRLESENGPVIIGGDFNLEPLTESVEMFEKNGYKNLIKDNKVKTTRNRLAWERFPDNPQYYADYVFINDKVKLKKFEVIENEVSDHLPLVIEI